MLTQADVHWIELDSVDSTNDYLARAYQQGLVSGPVAVLAREQTAGRGRAGRVWHAAPGASLCLSLGVTLAGYSMPFLPLCVGVAVAQQLEDLNVPVRLKWPNDFLVGQQKLGGVLCESFQVNGVPVTIIGVGLNVLPQRVPNAMAGHGSTCIADHIKGLPVPSPRALADLLAPAIFDKIGQARTQGFSAIFREFTQRDAWLGLNLQVIDQGQVSMSGKAMGIDENGAYLIDTDQGLRQVNSGDLSLRVVSK